METPLKNINNFKDKKNSSYIKKMFLSFSPSFSSTNNLVISAIKSQKFSNYSLNPQISSLTNSCIIKNQKKIIKRSPNNIQISKINNINSYEQKENIIYNKKFVQKNNNIIVAVRIRPLNQNEKIISSEMITKIENNNTLLIKNKNDYITSEENSLYKKFSSFNYLFDSYENQTKIFYDVLKNYIKDLINGKNITIISYGYKNSGKTYTLIGTIQNPGIIQNCLKEIFGNIKLYKNRDYKIKISYFIIVEDKIIDLLSNENEAKLDGGLNMKKINEDDDIFSFLSGKEDNYAKSHKIIQILINYKEKEIKKLGKINFIEIEENEKLNGFVEKENNSKIDFKRYFQNFFESTKNGNQTYTSFGNNKLSTLLKDLIDYNSKIIFIANISGFVFHYDDIINTLKFAEKLKKINNKFKNIITESTTENFDNNKAYSCKRLNTEIHSLKNILKPYKDKNPVINFNKSHSTLNYNESLKKIKEDTDDLKAEVYNQKDFGIISTENAIKENNLELEASELNDYLSEKDDKKVNSLIDNFIQQSQAEVKIKQKIMGIYYEIYQLNNSIKEKNKNKENVSDDKKKLKSIKKILSKNIQCLNDISQKNKITFKKYINVNENKMPKKDGNIYENDNDSNNEIELLNETQKKYISLITKYCELQKENIEIKFNYILIKDDLSKKDKIIKDLQSKIEMQDITIKEKLSLEKEELINEEFDEKSKILFSEKQKSKTLRKNYKDLNKYEIETDHTLNEISAYNTQENNSNRKRKRYHFNPRNSTSLKTKNISKYLKKKNSESPLSNLLLNKRIETNTEVRKDNYYQNSENNLNLFNFDNNINPTEYNDIIGKEFNEIIKNFNIEDQTEFNFGMKRSFSKNINDVINEDEGDEETNNKTLQSILNDIQTVNSNINKRLSVIERKPNNYKNSIIIKPISKTLSNFNDINNLFNKNETDYNNIYDNKKNYNSIIKNKLTKPFTDKKQKKKKINNPNIELNYNSSPNKMVLKLMNNQNNSKKFDFSSKKNSYKMKSPNLIIDTNPKNRKRKLTLNSSITTNFGRNTINNYENKKSLKAKIKMDKNKRSLVKKEKKKIKENNEKRNSIYIQNNDKPFSQDKDNSYYKVKITEKTKENLTKENNLHTNNLINSKMKNDEKIKLQIFYSEHLNNYKLNNTKKIFENNKINTDTSKNYKNISCNNDSTILVDITTNPDTFEKKYKTKQK